MTEVEAFEKQNTAPPGHYWVCLACGKYGPRRDKIGDEACFLGAKLYEIDRLEIVGRAVVEIK